MTSVHEIRRWYNKFEAFLNPKVGGPGLPGNGVEEQEQQQ